MSQWVATLAGILVGLVAVLVPLLIYLLNRAFNTARKLAEMETKTGTLWDWWKARGNGS